MIEPLTVDANGASLEAPFLVFARMSASMDGDQAAKRRSFTASANQATVAPIPSPIRCVGS